MKEFGPDYYNITEMLTEEELLIQKMIGYVSYVSGEDPFKFPTRIWPNMMNNPHSIKNMQLFLRNLLQEILRLWNLHIVYGSMLTIGNMVTDKEKQYLGEKIDREM